MGTAMLTATVADAVTIMDGAEGAVTITDGIGAAVTTSRRSSALLVALLCPICWGDTPQR